MYQNNLYYSIDKVIDENTKNETNELKASPTKNIGTPSTSISTENIVNNDEKKKEIVLNLINKILSNIGRPIITNLIEFVDIDKDKITKDENKKLILESGIDVDFFL